MKLYHFTPLHLVAPIQSEGLTRGVIPWRRGSRRGFIYNSQWLTTNPDFSQSWCDPQYTTLPYDRSAARFEVVIPKASRKILIPWLEVCKRMKWNEMIEDLNYCGGAESWWIFNGRIKPAWLRGIEYKEMQLCASS